MYNPQQIDLCNKFYIYIYIYYFIIIYILIHIIFNAIPLSLPRRVGRTQAPEKGHITWCTIRTSNI